MLAVEARTPQSKTALHGRIAFIVNPQGRNGRTGKEWKKILPKLHEALGEHRVATMVTEAPRHAEELTRQAVTGGAEAVVAVGGDGTIHEVLPCGTGSDYIRTFGWNNDVDAAILRIAKGNRRKVDVGFLTATAPDDTQGLGMRQRRYFANIASAGLSAETAMHVESVKFLGAKLAYVAATVIGFLRYRPPTCRMQIHGQEPVRLGRMTAVVVGNGQYFGGGMKIAPTASPFNGQLDVFALHHFRLLDFAMRGRHLFKGTAHLVEKQRIRVDRCMKLELEAEKGVRVPVEADGEYVGNLPASFEVVPNAIELLC
eukprot:jgi/Mesvir1/14408/Mv09795-RA.1